METKDSARLKKIRPRNIQNKKEKGHSEDYFIFKIHKIPDALIAGELNLKLFPKNVCLNERIARQTASVIPK